MTDQELNQKVEVKVIQVDLEKLFDGSLQKPIQIHNGDTIHIPKGAFVFVTGEVLKPGKYPLGRGTTVDRVIILAGGFTKFAAKKNLRVRRVIQGQTQEYRAQMHFISARCW